MAASGKGLARESFLRCVRRSARLTASIMGEACSHAYSAAISAPQVPIPKCDQIACADPRKDASIVSVIAFYYPGKEEEWDTICNSSVLGNFYPLPENEYITFAPPNHPDAVHTFSTSEAAYQALKFWHIAGEFAEQNAEGCYQLKKRLRGTEDESCGGYGSVWGAMHAVLLIKFKPGSHCSRALLATGDSFLVEHNNIIGRDKQWSDDRTGGGRNWLGLQLMLVRDKLTGKKAWAEWADKLVDLTTGKPRSAECERTYQAAVTAAATAILAELDRQAARPAAAAAAQ